MTRTLYCLVLGAGHACSSKFRITSAWRLHATLCGRLHHLPTSNFYFSHTSNPVHQFSIQTTLIARIKMALPGIEGFKNVYEILEAVSAGDKVRLRRAARKIRLVLMCADDTCLSEEHRACLTAILGLLVTDWEEAEVNRP